MPLRLYNTRTRRKEDFQPLDPKAVRMYVCGPTVYDFAHIGNARPVIVFDVLFRLLKHLAGNGEWDGGKGETKIVYARNITDVDDKINARAAQEGISIRELTERTAAQFHADVAALGCLPPTIEPRATEHITEMVSIIERLIARGHAYPAEGHVRFHVPSDPNYGALARRSLDEMRAGARVEVAPYKRDPMDFVLWKPSEGSDPGWESPWGYGRPGWHLECSAMAEKHLGDVFDIHGGGIDLLFPHHENELAQSTCVHGTKIMANIWMHNGHLQVEGEKMSKSLGNFITIHQLLKDWPGDVIRYQMLMTHYRQPLDWTEANSRQARLALLKFSRLLRDHRPTSGEISPAFLEALQDDLNTPAALSALHELWDSKTSRSDSGQIANWTYNALELIGIAEPHSFEQRLLRFEQSRASIGEDKIAELTKARLAARKAKNWAEADRIRDELAAMGIALKDAKNPETGEIETTWEIVR
jgi:cysteinyl-tRNA synthetase